VLVRSKRQKFICYTDRQLQKAKSICKSWSLSVSELQLTAPANAGVQKAESVCKSWRLSVSKLHTYFVEKRYTKSVANPVVKDLKGYSGFFRGFGRLFRSSFASPSPEKNLRFDIFEATLYPRCRFAKLAALCFGTSGNLAMMAANIAPLFQHGESSVLSSRSGSTAFIHGSQTLLMAERWTLP
jgi:hypothetical protein